MLTNEGSTLHGCYSPELHYTIPPTLAIGTDALRCEQPPSSGARATRIFFAGGASSTIRKNVIKKYRGGTDIFIPEKRLGFGEYLCEMARSVFCLVLRGEAAWSPRLAEAVGLGHHPETARKCM